ncbi:hypothetical protein OC842_004556 [Tilletia horrida]|uniref:Uncharacterized protein n=1 Tax=Tilletia horrida TaxID=155126 RepID=A0AAN6GBH4_9BASI|nr:hypothetical protein OC842_004556 [Tilletia horrida]
MDAKVDWSSFVLLLTRGTSPLARQLAVECIRARRLRAIVLVDGPPSEAMQAQLKELQDELFQLAWLVEEEQAGKCQPGTDASSAQLQARGAGGVMDVDQSGNAFQAVSKKRNPFKRDAATSVLDSDASSSSEPTPASAVAPSQGHFRSQPEPKAARAGSPTSHQRAGGPTRIKTSIIAARDFDATLRAVKETVAAFGRLDFVLILAPDDAPAEHAMSAADLVPILGQPPYATTLNGGNAQAECKPTRTNRSKPPRVRANPPPGASSWVAFDDAVRGTVNWVHAAVPALACPPRALPGPLPLSASSLAPRCINAMDDWPTPKALVLVSRNAQSSPPFCASAAVAASTSFLQSYASALPSPVRGSGLSHPVIPRIRFAALDLIAAEDPHQRPRETDVVREVLGFVEELVRNSEAESSEVFVHAKRPSPLRAEIQ